ncbi:ABC transporter ATP-binding protein [Adlercreutzia sp. ZJ154]|uniref:ABC transporter ATP-binding protein n=1 Tax=Adlercreutzia sp. ZJ154 TaxID=2709790 RepID=UPI0013EDC6A0|nr:ABC transporter ATP-binding protein [Adlercreutzia sp. ZJ154]
MHEIVHNMIEVRGLTKHYDNFTLDGVNLSVESGCVVGLIGGNGAGKTTTLKALLGIIDIDAGTIEVLGHKLPLKSSQNTNIKSRIGVVFDTCAFPKEGRVSDVELIGRMTYSNWDSNNFWELCSRFQLDKNKKVDDLSRGMGMKLTLAFAMSHNPSLLILDEATAGLDPIARADVLEILRKYMEKGDKSILLSTHITTDLDKIADRVVCLDNGRVVFDVDKDAICDIAGIVRCRTADFEAIKSSYALSPDAQPIRIMRNQYEIDLLAPDRTAFKQAYPNIVCDKVDIETYMTLFLKGERI